MQAYCVKCRAKKEMKSPKAITMKNGKPATQGTWSHMWDQDVQNREELITISNRTCKRLAIHLNRLPASFSLLHETSNCHLQKVTPKML